MPDTIKWLLLELGVALALVPAGVALIQWRRRRATEEALRALSQRVKQSETERKRTLTGILTGAHRLAETRSAEVADALIRSERTFFRHCFNTLLTQDQNSIEQLGDNLYSVLDDYLRKCAGEPERTATTVPAASSPHDAMGDVFAAAEAALDGAVPVAPPPPPPESATPAPDAEIDWDAAFAELNDEPAAPAPAMPPVATPPAPAVKADEELTQDALDRLLSATAPSARVAAPPEPTAAEDEGKDIMATRGEALEEQTAVPPQKPGEEDAFDLGWDDAFLEETLTIKPDAKPGS